MRITTKTIFRIIQFSLLIIASGLFILRFFILDSQSKDDTIYYFGIIGSMLSAIIVTLLRIEWQIESSNGEKLKYSIFKNLDETYGEMLTKSIHADSVDTKNFSEDPKNIEGKTKGGMKRYFESIHRHLKKNQSLRFRRIVSISNRQRAISFFDELKLFSGLNNLSINWSDIDQCENTIDHTHLVKRDNRYFVFHLISFAERQTQTYMIEGEDIYRVALENYNRAWDRSKSLLLEGRLNIENCRVLAERFELNNHKCFKELESLCG